MKLQQQLYERLEAIAAYLQASQTIDLKEFIQLIEVTMRLTVLGYAQLLSWNSRHLSEQVGFVVYKCNLQCPY
jgi:hypothetical protein